MKSKSTAPSASSPPARSRPYELHSGPLVRGLSKKMVTSASAFGVWDGAVDEAPVTVLDKNDPNYESEEEELQDFLATFESLLAVRSRTIDVPSRWRTEQESAASSPATKGR